MSKYNANPTLLEYITPMWGQVNYYMRLEELEASGTISRENPQTLRQIRMGFFSVPLVNLAVGGSAIFGLMGLAKLVQ